MFKILKKKFGKFTKVKLLNCDSNEYITIIPEFGANVNEIVLGKNNSLFSIIDGDKNSNELVKNEWFKGAKLIPFPNRINNGIYLHNDVEYKLPLNFIAQKHAIHGLVYNKPFKITKNKVTKSKAILTLEYTGNKLIGYPFNFLVSITYILSSKGFKCITSITNNDNLQIPVGDGWHPYFIMNRKVNDLFLKIPSTKKISVDNRMIPTGKVVMMKRFSRLNQINKQNFDTGFIISNAKKKIAITEIVNKILGITIQIWQETGKNKYNYLVVLN